MFTFEKKEVSCLIKYTKVHINLDKENTLKRFEMCILQRSAKNKNR